MHHTQKLHVQPRTHTHMLRDNMLACARVRKFEIRGAGGPVSDTHARDKKHTTHHSNRWNTSKP